jgi:hypothetical protein
MLDAAHLPDDIAPLNAMLLASEARVEHLSAELSTRTAEIEHLTLVLAKLRRMQFGRRSARVRSNPVLIVLTHHPLGGSRLPLRAR